MVAVGVAVVVGLMLQPRKYQLDAIQAFHRSIASENVKRMLLVLPTGTGKTLTALLLARDFEGPILWLAHRDELIQQPMVSAKVVLPGRSLGIVKADMDEWRSDIVFASIQTACRDQRLERLASRLWSLVVVDESHHAPSASWRKVIEGCGCLAPGGPPLLGLTATPERLDSARLDDLFQKVVYQYHLYQAIEDGFLAPPDIVMEAIKINLDSVHSLGGDFNPGELDMALLEGGIIDSIYNAIKTHAVDRKTLIFTVSVKQSKMVAAALTAGGLTASSIDGTMGVEERRYILKNFARGHIQYLSNCAVLTEGFDEPTISCILMARPTQSKTLFIQCVGRGLRLSPGKENCRIIDMVALSNRHSLIQAPVIFGADIEEEEKTAKEQPLFKVDPIEYWRQRLSTQILGLRSISRSDMHWIRGNAGELLLGVGNFGTVRLRPSDGLWFCEVIGNRENKTDLEPLAENPINLELAQGIGEDYIRRCKAVTLARGGKWRDQPASEAQIEALRRWKINAPNGLSKGQASEMLTAQAAKRFELATPKQVQYLRHLGVATPDGLTKGQAGKLISAWTYKRVSG